MNNKKQNEMKYPMQPIHLDEHRVARFKENKIVRYLLDNGGIDMNAIAILDFPQEDQEQFAQLIGYSVSGFSDLSYASDEVCEEAFKISDKIIETKNTNE